jgi:hypothetical protein
MHVTIYSRIKVRTVNKILLPAWHRMICWFCKYRCQNNYYMNHFFHEWFSFARTNITEMHNTVTRVCYMSMHSLCIHHTNVNHVTKNDSIDTMEYKKQKDDALLRVWLHIICETRTDASNQPVASISRIFYPEDVNITLLRRQVHIHQIKTASHPKASLSQPPTINCQYCSGKLQLIVKYYNPRASEKCGLHVKESGTYHNLLGAFACSRPAPNYLSFNWRETKTWRGLPSSIFNYKMFTRARFCVEHSNSPHENIRPCLSVSIFFTRRPTIFEFGANVPGTYT